MLHQSLYPWLYGHKFKNFGEILKSSEGKGIVICTGDKHFKYARSTIDTFRHILNCTLPIEVFYGGEKDLSKSNREILLREYDQVYVTDITTFFDNTIIDLQGWSVKPYAVLASRFEEVILLDADITFIRNPSILFDDKGYQEKGTLFFKDRTLHPGRNPSITWLKSWMIHPLPQTKESRFWNEKSRHEMESGTVLIHKTKTILGLLNVCKLNEKKIREKVVYHKVYGDKETFWMGFDMARQSYHMNGKPCTLIGQYVQGRSICGQIGQQLEAGKIVFWNGHIIKDKNDRRNRKVLVNFNAYFADENPSIWDDYLECILLRSEVEPTEFDEEERGIFKAIIEREKEKHFVIS
ncbi:glycosyltransferase family 71 protein [Piromyces sp. E2]|nr:glycosyltransferase family 71 protein [Piromyces sp. E2]|eukprot:OUM61663.1 glycosyltransferase family 71 protein [Piromyces sp. E2]